MKNGAKRMWRVLGGTLSDISIESTKCPKIKTGYHNWRGGVTRCSRCGAEKKKIIRAQVQAQMARHLVFNRPARARRIAALERRIATARQSIVNARREINDLRELARRMKLPS